MPRLLIWEIAHLGVLFWKGFVLLEQTATLIKPVCLRRDELIRDTHWKLLAYVLHGNWTQTFIMEVNQTYFNVHIWRQYCENDLVMLLFTVWMCFNVDREVLLFWKLQIQLQIQVDCFMIRRSAGSLYSFKCNVFVLICFFISCSFELINCAD